MNKRAALGIAFALLLSACAKNSSNPQSASPAENQNQPASVEAQAAVAECSEQFVKDYLRVYKADADLINNRVYGNFSAMEDRINLVAVRNVCDSFHNNHGVQDCLAKVEDAVWHINTKDLDQICDSNRK